MKTGIKIVHNKLLGGWYVVRGPHHFPLSGRFATKADAEWWLYNRREQMVKVRNLPEQKIQP